MNEQIEIKHLAPYLPYGVKILRPDGKTLLQLIGIENNLLIFREPNRDNVSYGDITKNKLALRPMSDLTKEIEVNGERFIPIIELLKMSFHEWVEEHKEGRYSIVNYSSDGYPKAWVELMATKLIMLNTSFINEEKYWIVQKLIEWHFDVSNLIPQNLAIDINSLNK